LWVKSRRSRRKKVMSALPPKADMCGATRNVRFGPKADIAWTEHKTFKRRVVGYFMIGALPVASIFIGISAGMIALLFLPTVGKSWGVTVRSAPESTSIARTES